MKSTLYLACFTTFEADIFYPLLRSNQYSSSVRPSTIDESTEWGM